MALQKYKFPIVDAKQMNNELFKYVVTMVALTRSDNTYQCINYSFKNYTSMVFNVNFSN